MRACVRKSESLVGTLDAHVRVTDLDTRCDIIPSAVHVDEHKYRMPRVLAHTAIGRTRTRVRVRACQLLRDPVHVTRAHKRGRHIPPVWGCAPLVHPCIIRMHVDGRASHRRWETNVRARARYADAREKHLRQRDKNFCYRRESIATRDNSRLPLESKAR